MKETRVLEREELIRNTFMRDFKLVEGMAELYTGWQRQVGGTKLGHFQSVALLAEHTRRWPR